MISPRISSRICWRTASGTRATRTAPAGGGGGGGAAAAMRAFSASPCGLGQQGIAIGLRERALGHQQSG